jgi:hypothetical protein
MYSTRDLKGNAIQEFVEMGVAARTAGASLREPVEWHGINWKEVYRNVRRLQARTVKAIQVAKPRPVSEALAEA